MAVNVVQKIDNNTDEILDHLGDPHKTGKWERRELALGDVQSGKTANFIGVMCKAADAGYKVIIVLCGPLNSFRSQIQKRIDSDFIGFCSMQEKEIGVAKFDNARRPFSLTSAVEDFRMTAAREMWIDLDALDEPVVFVLKKNATVLRNLQYWLAANNKHGLIEYPMLLIDAEADHSLMIINKAEMNSSSINKDICPQLVFVNESLNAPRVQ